MKYLTFIFIALIIFTFVVPVHAQPANADPSEGGLVKCGRLLDSEGKLENPCDFVDLIATAQNLVNWLIYISVFVGAAMFTYAGYLYVTAFGNETQVAKAHETFKTVIVGFILVLAAWLIVYTISIAVVEDPDILLLRPSS